MNASQYWSICSEAAASSEALFCNVYVALICTIVDSVYVTVWLLNWFQFFNLWDLTFVFPRMMLGECRMFCKVLGHVDCPTNRLSFSWSKRKLVSFVTRWKKIDRMSLGWCWSTCWLKELEISGKVHTNWKSDGIRYFLALGCHSGQVQFLYTSIC
jgi:hypothetical protein